METPVSSMKVAIRCRTSKLPKSLPAKWGVVRGALSGGRIAVDSLLTDCQYRKGTALYDQCGVFSMEW